MPYNTRRKSLSLPSLGIQLPQSSGKKVQTNSPSPSKSDQPPQKKFKREYSPTVAALRQDRYGSNLPPSPPPETRISHDGINDEIVSGVVDVLERTGNRPHTVKELAAELAGAVDIVENSANPHAIISSRLNSFLKRGYTPSAPCIIAKQLITTHPRRIYFYLTTCPHQPIPKHENDVPSKRSVVSPALSDDEEDRRRTEMSPSPEVDLGLGDESEAESPDESSSSLSASRASIIARERTTSPASLDNKSALSTPALEGDEREFSQSAIFIVRRSASRELDQNKETSNKRSREEYEADGGDDHHIESSTSDATTMLLGYSSATPAVPVFNSPMVGPTNITAPITPVVKRENSVGTDAAQSHDRDQEKSSSISEESVLGLGLGNWGGELERHLGSPESVELDELDDLLDF